MYAPIPTNLINDLANSLRVVLQMAEADVRHDEPISAEPLLDALDRAGFELEAHQGGIHGTRLTIRRPAFGR
jgi:hypothetical protein